VGLGEASEFSKPSTGGVCSGDSGGPIFQGDTTVLTAVVSFTTDSTCSGVTGGYRLDQPDDLTFLGTYVD
jgi:secreted trypsin-like serine protease